MGRNESDWSIFLVGSPGNNNCNYPSITLFPTICKVYEVVLNRLEIYAIKNNLFSHLQFGFQKGMSCIEASFTVLETTNHILERGSKIFGCFLDVRKPFDTVSIDDPLCKLLHEFDMKDKM